MNTEKRKPVLLAEKRQTLNVYATEVRGVQLETITEPNGHRFYYLTDGTSFVKAFAAIPPLPAQVMIFGREARANYREGSA